MTAARMYREKNVPFGMTSKLVTEDGDPVDSPTCLEMALKLFRRRSVVDLVHTSMSESSFKFSAFQAQRWPMTRNPDHAEIEV
jgi:hypothetical protein